MGPGPWSFHTTLKLPTACGLLHFTNKNRKSNIQIAHTLKIVIRVERGDDLHIDPKTGKRKLFDIVVQTPVHILSVSPCFLVPLAMGGLTRVYAVPVQLGTHISPAVL